MFGRSVWCTVTVSDSVVSSGSSDVTVTERCTSPGPVHSISQVTSCTLLAATIQSVALPSLFGLFCGLTRSAFPVQKSSAHTPATSVPRSVSLPLVISALTANLSYWLKVSQVVGLIISTVKGICSTVMGQGGSSMLSGSIAFPVF